MNTLQVIESIEENGIEWVVSLTDHNPKEEYCFIVPNSKEAFKAKSILEDWSKENSIDFCQWVAQEGYEMLLGCYAWERPGDINSVSTDKLYKMYLQSKSLAV